MKSLGVVALVVIATWCGSCQNVGAQAPAAAPAVDSAASSSPPVEIDPVTGLPANTHRLTAVPLTSPAESASNKPPVPKPPEAGAEQAIINGQSMQNAHLATPAGEIPVTSYPALRQFLEDSQNAHDKMIVDRFLIGVAILFSIIAAALLFSLPPKPREQKE